MQAIHYAWDSALHFRPHQPTLSVAILQVGSLQELLDAKQGLEALGIETFMFDDDDLPDRHGAFVTAPMDKKKHKKFLPKYKKWIAPNVSQ